ncbi:MAG TPA: hypothetical protein VJR89_03730, partial [Polyangiales bacterium]|nr:hypothetical protein [Polyangiales bacterium]
MLRQDVDEAVGDDRDDERQDGNVDEGEWRSVMQESPDFFHGIAAPFIRPEAPEDAAVPTLRT